MPFIDDTGVRTEDHTGPIWGSLAVFVSQLERMIAVNLAWSVHAVPALAGIMLGDLPFAARVALIGYSTVTVPIATSALVTLVDRAFDGEHIGLAGLLTVIRQRAMPGLRVLLPLEVMCGVLLLAALSADRAGLFAVSVALRLVGLGVLVSSMYWCALLARDTDPSAWCVLRGSMILAWRHPGTTSRVALMTVLVVVVGLVTGGWFLVVGAIAMCLQVGLLRTVDDERGRDEPVDGAPADRTTTSGRMS